MSEEPLRIADHWIFLCRGAVYEGDIFSVLKRSPFVVRAIEFGLADGAIDCVADYEPGESFANRYWSIHERRHTDPTTLMLFEAKSTVGIKAGDQFYGSTISQRRHVAFYIGINAAEPTFVDLIPNYFQEAAALNEEGARSIINVADKKDVGVHIKRQSTLPPSAYGGIDQSLSPYRIPLWMLPSAIQSIRQCYLQGITFVNPWTGVEYTGWTPAVTTQTSFLRPWDKASQATAYEALIDLYRVTRYHPKSKLTIDLLGLQPSLADLKLLLDGRQYFVQHKLSTQVRAKNAPLNKVAMARYDGIYRQFYFSAFDRFDFLWYQFMFSHGDKGVQSEFFFLPERELPDDFFTTEEKETSFEIYPHFQEYRIILDDDGDWIGKVESILRRYPEPRQPTDRPLRRSQPTGVSLDDLPQSSVQVPPRIATTASQGRRLFADLMRARHREFFYRVMSVCAKRKSGLLVVLARGHPWGDFGFCRFRWTPQEASDFLTKALLPKAAHHLPNDVDIIPITYYTQYAEATFLGPNVRPRHYRRLNASAEARLTIWDLAGPDTDIPLKAAVIPTDDIMPSAGQSAIFERNLKPAKGAGHREEKNPNLSALLTTGLYAGEYGVGNGGPMQYDEDGVDQWRAIWELLYNFTDHESVEHPKGIFRKTANYRHCLSAAHQRLFAQHRIDMARASDGTERQERSDDEE